MTYKQVMLHIENTGSKYCTCINIKCVVIVHCNTTRRCPIELYTIKSY